MTALYLPPLQAYHPSTFLERGVAVPLTTPLLGGTRARPATKPGVELIIPNPSGGRGVYILSWSGISAMCQPTLHDKIFSKRIGELPSVTPGTIRRIAREIAAEGLAGEEAMEAARQAGHRDKDDRLVTNYLLLMNLIEQVNVVPAGSAGAVPLDQEAKARLTVAWVAPRIGRTPAWTASALEDLADVFGNIGVSSSAPPARTPRLHALLRATRAEIETWGKSLSQQVHDPLARTICDVADVTLSLSANLLKRAADMTASMMELLRAWSADPAAVAHIAARPEWLLDGWEQICLIWNFALDDAARRAALVEIAGLLPLLPREVSDWCDTAPDATGPGHVRRMVRLNEDWRTGATVMDLIARNEHFRAITA